jgi:hypothetical protein
MINKENSRVSGRIIWSQTSDPSSAVASHTCTFIKIAATRSRCESTTNIRWFKNSKRQMCLLFLLKAMPLVLKLHFLPQVIYLYGKMVDRLFRISLQTLEG